MARHDTYVSALARAAEKVGGIDALAAKLVISKAMLRAWLNGTHEIPSQIFLRIVDVLMEDNERPLGSHPSRQTDPIQRRS